MARRTGSNGTETAEKVRKAALGLFARHGYAAVSMRRIAGEVGLQAGALYNHFDTKQELLRQLMANHLAELVAAWRGASLENATATEQLRAFVHFHVSYHAGRGDDVFVSYMELRNLEPANFDEIDALRRRYEKFLRDILDKGVANGEFELVDIAVSAMAIIAMLTGVTTWYRPGGRLSMKEIETIYVTMVLASVGARAQPSGAT